MLLEDKVGGQIINFFSQNHTFFIFYSELLNDIDNEHCCLSVF